MNTRDNAKMEIEDFIFPEISFTYTRKSIGQNMEPCGTPQFVHNIPYLAFEIHTNWDLPSR